MKIQRQFFPLVLCGFALVLASLASHAQQIPKLAKQDNPFALMFDGRPFLILGAQINNSSAWPEVLPQVWPTLASMHVNTVEAPVYWEQFEPKPGQFDYSCIDALIRGSREHSLRLVVLWFGTWKNGQMHYVPEWVKKDPSRYPRMLNNHGQAVDVLSANSTSNLEADKKAFAALMRHIKEVDGEQHTVILVQVENISGAIGTVRDYSPAAEKQFREQVPGDLLKALGKRPGTWSEVFGGDADETFQAYYQAHYVNAVTEAGKAEYPLPMYINVWLSYPPAELPERRIPIPGIQYPSGGAVERMIGLWRAMAPAVDMIGPDIYTDDSQQYRHVLEAYHRPDNPAWIPETGSGNGYAKFFFYTLGHGGIGFSPFGVDETGWTYAKGNYPVGHAENYGLVSSMDRELAQLNFDGKLKTAVEEKGAVQQELDFGDWQATVSFGFPQHDGRRAPGTEDAHGRAQVAQLSANEFLVTGIDASVSFHLPGKLSGQQMQIMRAEEGHYENGTWKFRRFWNGDQTDRGLNFKHEGEVVRITLGPLS
jgi:beta-galactosidase GanA